MRSKWHRSLSFLTGLLFLASSCARPFYVREYHPRQYPISKEGPADSVMLQMLQPYKRGVDTQMQVVIGHADIPLTKAQPESTLGNFMADAQLTAARAIDPKVVAAVSNYGGLRINYLSPGPITRGNLYELMPFDNMLTLVEIPGSVLKQFCDAMARSKGWPVSGLQFTIRDKQAEGILVGGMPLDEHRVYLIAVNDYIARGGDNCDYLVPLKKRFTTVFLRDALIRYLAGLEASGQPLHPVLDNRIKYAE